jgi:hypothetical protein
LFLRIVSAVALRVRLEDRLQCKLLLRDISIRGRQHGHLGFEATSQVILVFGR